MSKESITPESIVKALEKILDDRIEKASDLTFEQVLETELARANNPALEKILEEIMKKERLQEAVQSLDAEIEKANNAGVKNALFKIRQKVVSAEQKTLLKDVLHDAFNKTAEYADRKYMELESRINSELPDVFDNYYIYTAVARRENTAGLLSNFWFEVEPPREHKQNALLIKRVFANCGYKAIEQYINSAVTADIRTSKKEYHGVKIKIDFSSAYTDKIKELHALFSENGKPWLTVNCPFMFKFLDMTLESPGIGEDELKTAEIIWRKDFGLAEYIRDDAVLLWNIEERPEEKAVSVLELPAGNTILYEHKMKIAYPESSYLFYGENLEKVSAVARAGQPKNIFFTSEKPEYENIRIYRIANIDEAYSGKAGLYEKEKERLFCEPQTNARKTRHTDRQADMPRSARGAVFTRGEIERICGSHDVSLRLKEIYVSDDAGGCESCRDLNFFIETQRIDKSRKTLVLKFEAGESDIFAHEKMWFLTSELQLYFNEYKCAGQII